MPIQGFLHSQRDFQAGQLDATAARRHDTDIVKAGALKMEQASIMLTGGWRRRAGTTLKFYGGPIVKRIQPAPDVHFDVEFTNHQFRARDDDGNEQILVAPWAASQVHSLRYELFDNRLLVVCHGMNPQVLEYDEDAGTWSIADFTFQVGPNLMARQPFYRFAEKGITMQPSTDNIGPGVTVTFSDAVLKPSMVGTELRYAERRTKMTAYVSPTVGTFQNLEQLPPSQRLTLRAGDVTGYRLGDALEGFVSGAKGILIAQNPGANTLDVLVTSRYKGFLNDTSQNAEKIVAPEADGVCNATAFISPLPTVFWDEQFMGDFRGWPGNVSVDRQRVMFYDFLQLPGGILWSEVGQYNAFDIGQPESNATGGSTANIVDASMGIFEITPLRERVIQMMGGPDQFVFTPDAIYYIPISSSSPLAPGSVEFLQIGNGGASPNVRPVQTSSAILYPSLDNQRIMAVRATGTQTRPYELVHTSKYHSSLIKTPIAMTVSVGQEIDSGEVLYIVNIDGTVTVGRYNAAADFLGYVPWFTQGNFVGVTAHDEVVLLMAHHGTLFTVENLDETVLLDCMVETADTSGGPELIPWAGFTLHRIVNGLYMGTAVPDGTGFTSTDSHPIDTQWGFRFDPTFSPFLRNFEGGGGGYAYRSDQRMRKRKIKAGAITVRDSGPFRVGKTDLNDYHVGDDYTLPPPLRSDTFLFRAQGRSFEPTFVMVQEAPYPLKVIEVTAEVTS